MRLCYNMVVRTKSKIGLGPLSLRDFTEMFIIKGRLSK